MMMPLCPKESSHLHSNKSKDTINFTIVDVVVYDWCIIEVMLTMVPCDNDVLQITHLNRLRKKL